MKNVLVIGGDRYSPSESSMLSKNVYDFAGSIELIRGISALEQEIDGVDFCIVAGTDPTVVYTRDKDRISDELSRLIERQDAGADLIQTQPVFDLQFLEFLDVAKERGLKIPVLAGILPLRGKTDCVEVERRYRITIPDDLKSRLDREEEGRRLACELAASLVRNGVSSLHVYPRENCDFLTEVAGAAFT